MEEGRCRKRPEREAEKKGEAGAGGRSGVGREAEARKGVE